MSFIIFPHSCGCYHIKMVILMMVMLEINMIFCVLISCLVLYSGDIWFESQQGLIDFNDAVNCMGYITSGEMGR